MAHILAGDWTSFTREVTGSTTFDPDRPELGMPNTIHLEIDEQTGEILAGSMHGPAALTGRVRPEGMRHAIEINNLSRNRRYEGVFCATVQAFGQTPKLVMAGKLRLNVQFGPGGQPVADTAEARDKNSTEDFAQDQEIWIASKP